MQMYENDYVMRMIKTTLQALASFFKGRNALENSIDKKNGDIFITKDTMLELMIKKYLSEGEINKAENILIEAIESHKSPKYLELALSFYGEISEWDEAKLISCNFSKEEILEGLDFIKKLYNE